MKSLLPVSLCFASVAAQVPSIAPVTTSTPTMPIFARAETSGPTVTAAVSDVPSATPTEAGVSPTLEPSVSISPTAPTAAPSERPPTAFCNICGSGNILKEPDNSFKYYDDAGVQQERGCGQMQQLVNLPNAPFNFCEIVQAYATEPCGCETPDGRAVEPADLSPGYRFCNICGPGNSIGDPRAVVPLVNPKQLTTRFPCAELQRLANVRYVFPEDFCDDIVEQSQATCRCYDGSGGLVSDGWEYPTYSPVNGGAAATPGHPDNPATSPSQPTTDESPTDGGTSSTVRMGTSVAMAGLLIVMI